MPTKRKVSAEAVAGFKAFDKNLRCRNHQYKIGKTYTISGTIEMCERGFHFCEDPLHVLAYYPPDSRFCRVIAEAVLPSTGGDKRVAGSITIGEEMLLAQMIEESVALRIKAAGDDVVRDAIHSGAATASGYSGAATASGDSGAATASGDRGAATASGDRGAATASGRESCAISLGVNGKAKSSLGSWITLAEWKYTDRWHRTDVQTRKVDGEEIKTDTWYMLLGGEFVVVE